jgi:hypothetical protein
MAGNRWWTSGNGTGRPYLKHGTESGQGFSIHSYGAVAPIAPGTPLIIDWRGLKTGPLSWKDPRDFTKLTPVDRAPPPTPTGYLEGFQVPILVQGHVLSEFTNTSEYTNSTFFTLHGLYVLNVESERGLLPIYTIAPSEAIFNSAYSRNFYKPVLKPTGRWAARDDTVFGPPLVAPPRPRIGSAPAAAALPSEELASASDALFADPTTPAVIAPMVAPAPAPVPPPLVAEHLFANALPPVAAVAPTAQQAAAVAAARPRPLPVP